MCDAKSSWPELRGTPAAAARQRIMGERPDVQVLLVPVGSMVTADVNNKRVRVFFDTSEKVAGIPKIG